MGWTAPRTWVVGDLVDAVLMNAHVRDNLNAIGPTYTARKAADESVTESTTLQDDNHLSISIGANEVMLFETFLIADVVDAGTDIKLAFVGPSGSTIAWRAAHPGTADAFAIPESIAGGAEEQAPLTTTKRAIYAKGIIRNGATAGTLKLQWANAALTEFGDTTTVYTDSWLVAKLLTS